MSECVLFLQHKLKFYIHVVLNIIIICINTDDPKNSEITVILKKRQTYSSFNKQFICVILFITKQIFLHVCIYTCMHTYIKPV